MSGVSSTVGNQCCVLQSVVNTLMGGCVVNGSIYFLSSCGSFNIDMNIDKVIKLHKNKICNTC